MQVFVVWPFIRKTEGAEDADENYNGKYKEKIQNIFKVKMMIFVAPFQNILSGAFRFSWTKAEWWQKDENQINGNFP